MSDKIRWGLMGLGSIARRFVGSMPYAPNAELYAVASRSQDKADAFGAEFGAAKCYGSYEAMLGDPAVEVIYVATPHNFHLPHTLMALEAGKHALCEKPFAVNAAEARQMVARAREKGLFLMDAFWTRYFPAMVKLRALLAENAIGEVMHAQVDFGFRTPRVDPTSRHYDPELAGGALLDVGSYCVQFASMVFGKQPSDIVSQVTLGSTGVDEMSVTVFKYSDYEMATLTTAIRMTTPHEAMVLGTEGRITIPDFWHPRQLNLAVAGQEPQTFHWDIPAEGFQFEMIEVGECIRAGKTESAVYPLDETLAIMETLDRIRGQWGLRYPME